MRLRTVAFRRRRFGWPLFGRVGRQEDLMGEMMARLAVDPGAAAREDAGRAFAQALDRCITCRDTAACRAWLDGGGACHAPGFCPNAEYFQRVRDPGHHG